MSLDLNLLRRRLLFWLRSWSRSASDTVQNYKDRSDLDCLPFLCKNLFNFSFCGRRYLNSSLVGHYLDHRLVLFDVLTLAYQPLDNLSFRYSLPQIWEFEFNDHGSVFLLLPKSPSYLRFTKALMPD